MDSVVWRGHGWALVFVTGGRKTGLFVNCQWFGSECDGVSAQIWTKFQEMYNVMTEQSFGPI
jgi:hypothetical protein